MVNEVIKRELLVDVDMDEEGDGDGDGKGDKQGDKQFYEVPNPTGDQDQLIGRASRCFQFLAGDLAIIKTFVYSMILSPQQRDQGLGGRIYVHNRTLLIMDGCEYFCVSVRYR